MKNLSNYDKLHDRIWSEAINKSGSRYERLTAFVIKSLEEKATVIHDVKLIGNSDVKHQIDVTIGDGSTKKRVLIECKDFDLSGNKVGLGIIRDFWGVIDDVHPDEAVVITCIGFTKDAMKYAKNKGIKLAILREFTELDKKGRLQKIALEIHILSLTEPRASICFSTEESIDKYYKDLSNAGINSHVSSKAGKVFLNFEDERVQINEYVKRIMNDHPRESPGSVRLPLVFSKASIEVEKRGRIDIEGILLEFEVVHHQESRSIMSDKVARLILSDTSDSDIVIYEEDIRKLSIDKATGEIIT